MSRNALYLMIGALVIACAGLGFWVYQERQEPTGVEINLDPGGVSIEAK